MRIDAATPTEMDSPPSTFLDASRSAALPSPLPRLRLPAFPAVDAGRVLDIAFAAALLLLLAPVLLAIALAIRLDSSGPVLFRQARIGRGGRLFTVLKFRTMRHGAPTEAHQAYIAQLATAPESTGGGLQKLTADPRVTRVGSFLRRTSLDELPQFFNVVLGQMSVVGPRPALAYELAHYEPEHFERFSVRPGLTGLWQVSGRSSIGFLGMLELDAQYARTATLGLDLKIIARTPIALLRGHAA